MKDNINKKAVGSRIKAIRKANGDTLEQFGKPLNADKSLVSRWEKGQSIPNPERIKKIAESSNLTVNELLYGDYDTYLHLRIMELAPKCIKNYDEHSSLHDSIIDKALIIAKNITSKIDYNLSDQTIKKFIELAIEQSSDLYGNLIENDLANFDYSLFGGTRNQEYFYFGYKLVYKEKKLYTAVLAILNQPTHTIYIDDMSKDRFFNFFGSDIPNSTLQSIDYITPLEIVSFSTYIRQRSKIVPKILEDILKLGFLLENVDISGYTVNILENQLSKHKTIKIDNN
ncbi:helix-turn-helix domain-containing protein [Streptococcus constellatus]|uniref:helix-turn-helix domain-containing protein n=1 Tax=Streptococcus constellatus TaxID=76860 RepID=UPI0021030D3C|nr:helix-turn-helix transcriptional regulator [Streptococcus constellatus]UTX65036.1 XRE family transcriptional regulator [Streptococcus constellatus]